VAISGSDLTKRTAGGECPAWACSLVLSWRRVDVEMEGRLGCGQGLGVV
jgi:hypothetical protein